MEPRKRNHPAYILKNIYTLIKQMLFPLIILVASNLKDLKLIYIVLGGLLIFLVISLIAYMGWKNYVYYIQENMLWVEKGVLTKNRKSISLDKITTVNDNQGIIERIFHLETLKIDTGSVSGAGKKDNEVALLLSKSEAEAVKNQFIKTSKPQNPLKKQELSYTASVRELLIYAVTSNGVFAGLIFITSAYQLIKDLPSVDKIVEGTFKKVFNNTFQTPISEMYFGKAVAVSLLLFVIYLIFSFVISIVRALIKYYGFSASRQEDEIIISYGLLEKKKFSMPVKKIKAVYCKYGLLGQLFSLSSIHLESIGYGDEKGEIAILYPLLTEKKKEEVILKLIPEFVFHGEFTKPPKRALKSYLFASLIVPLILCVIAWKVFEYGYLSFFLLLVFALLGYRSYKNCAILKGSSMIVICRGAVTHEVVILPIESVQSTTERQTIFQKRNRLMNISFSYQSNTLGKIVGVSHIDVSAKEEFLSH